jgi:hypothetical protein
LAHCKENASDLRAQILKALIKSAKGYDVDPTDQEAMAKLGNYAAEICSEIDKYSLQVSGRDKLVRYNKRVLRSALAFWLESPGAYERLRECSIEILPSASRLQKLQRTLIHPEGPFPECYGWFQDEHRGSNQQVEQRYDNHIVQVLFDEMNLRTEVVTNISNQRTTGFTASDGHNNTIDLAMEVKHLFSVAEVSDGAAAADVSTFAKRGDASEDYDDSKHVAKKVNLFRIRTIYGISENFEFFYNDGSLTGDDLLEQVLRVIMLCEMTGLRVYILVSDAGGAK